jgi:tetratricopeptide (TPR) repeat protein
MRAWNLIVQYEHNRCHWESRREALEQARTYATRAGEEQNEQEFQAREAVSYLSGPCPVDVALAWFEEHAALETHNPVMVSQRAALEAMRGNFDAARTLLEQGKQRLTELGHSTFLVLQTEREWEIEMLAGNPAAAERRIRWGCEMLERMGERSWLSTSAAELAQALFALGRVDEASEWADKSNDLGASEDILTQMLWRQAAAKVYAARGEGGAAVRLALEAVALAEGTDGLNRHADALLDLAQVFELLGKHEEASSRSVRHSTSTPARGTSSWRIEPEHGSRR